MSDKGKILLTDKSLCDSSCSSLHSKVNSTHLGLVGWDTRWNWDWLDTIRAQVGDIDENSTSGSIWSNHSSWRCTNLEGIWGCCGRLFPLNSAISLLSSDTVLIGLGLKQLGSSKVVALYTSRNSSEVLGAVSWGPKHINRNTLDVLVKTSFDDTYFHDAVHEICLARIL